MFGTKARLSLVETALVAGCSDAPDVVAGSGDLLVYGVVERETTDHTDNAPLLGAADTHVVIELRRYQAEDADAPLVLAVDRPVREVPFDFELRGDAAAAFPNPRTELLVSVTVFQHAGTNPRVGDLTSESRISLTRAGQWLTIAVGGLEACGGANAGGFCTSE